MRLVADRVGLSTGTLNHHFRNKAGLLEAALDYAYQEPPDWADHSGDARSALRKLASRYVLRKKSVRAWWRFWCTMTAHAAKDRRVALRQLENHRRLISFFARVIAGGVKRGELRAGIQPRREAERLVAFAHGVALRQLVDPSPRATSAAAALLNAELDSLAMSRTIVRLSRS